MRHSIFVFVSRYDINRRLFEAEEQDLFADLQSLPRNAALRYSKLIHFLMNLFCGKMFIFYRKLNDLIKRARLAKVMIIITRFVVFET